MLPALEALGWNTRDPAQVRPEESAQLGAADYALFKKADKPVLIIEVKNLSADPDDAKVLAQVGKYAWEQGVEFGVATNGARWVLIDSEPGKAPKECIVWKANLADESNDGETMFYLGSLRRNKIEQLDGFVRHLREVDDVLAVWETLRKDQHKLAEVVAKAIKNVAGKKGLLKGVGFGTVRAYAQAILKRELRRGPPSRWEMVRPVEDKEAEDPYREYWQERCSAEVWRLLLALLDVVVGQVPGVGYSWESKTRIPIKRRAGKGPMSNVNWIAIHPRKDGLLLRFVLAKKKFKPSEVCKRLGLPPTSASGKPSVTVEPEKWAPSHHERFTIRIPRNYNVRSEGFICFLREAAESVSHWLFPTRSKK